MCCCIYLIYRSLSDAAPDDTGYPCDIQGMTGADSAGLECAKSAKSIAVCAGYERQQNSIAIVAQNEINLKGRLESAFNMRYNDVAVCATREQQHEDSVGYGQGFSEWKFLPIQRYRNDFL